MSRVPTAAGPPGVGAHAVHPPPREARRAGRVGVVASCPPQDRSPGSKFRFQHRLLLPRGHKDTQYLSIVPIFLSNSLGPFRALWSGPQCPPAHWVTLPHCRAPCTSSSKPSPPPGCPPRSRLERCSPHSRTIHLSGLSRTISSSWPALCTQGSGQYPPAHAHPPGSWGGSHPALGTATPPA